MNTHIRALVRTTKAATVLMVIITACLGIVYTLVMTGIGQLVLPHQANGSVVTTADGDEVGSALIGQSFADAEGNPLPEYFQSRPSAAGDGHDGGASSGSNYGPENEDLIQAVTERIEQVATFNEVDPADVPADAVTASGSGLDPHISPAYAEIQIERVAEARDLPVEQVRELVEANTQGPAWGYFGEAKVNVLLLNVALDELEG